MNDAQTAIDAWMVRWVLLGQPGVLSWDMLVTIPEEVLQPDGPPAFIDANDHVFVSRFESWYYAITDLPPPDPLPEGVIYHPRPKGRGLQIPRYQAKSMEPICALLQEIYKHVQP